MKHMNWQKILNSNEKGNFVLIKKASMACMGMQFWLRWSETSINYAEFQWVTQWKNGRNNPRSTLSRGQEKWPVAHDVPSTANPVLISSYHKHCFPEKLLILPELESEAFLNTGMWTKTTDLCASIYQLSGAKYPIKVSKNTLLSDFAFRLM